jgi:fucose permease
MASASVLGYWIALSVTRLGSGLVAVHRPDIWLLGGCALAVFGAVLLVAAEHMNATVAVVGLVLLGAGAGPLLPVLTARTPHRVGPAAAARVMGWQLAAASVGAAVVSGGIGLCVHASGVGAVAPALVVTAVVTAIVVAIVELRMPAGPFAASTLATAVPPRVTPRR